LFKTVYTLQGKMLSTLQEVKDYCEAPLGDLLVKKVKLRDDDQSPLKDGETLETPKYSKNLVNKASFIFNPL
jgi:hypothetical protein